MNVGDRVVFVGPEFASGVGNLRLGRRGVVTGREGHVMLQIGEEPQELVSVRFDGDDQDTVLSVDKIEEVWG